MRILALDYGDVHCGVAVCDPTGSIVRPLDPVDRPNTRKGFQRVRRLIDEVGAEQIVVGLPLSLSGNDSQQTTETREFVERLRAAVSIEVELYDERFTTKLAQTVGEGSSASEHSRAAAILLEDWIAYTAGTG